MAAIASPQPAGQLRLGVSNSLSDGPLPALLTRFARTHPNVQVNVRTGFSAGLVAGISSAAEFDAVLVLDEPGNTRNGVVLAESSQMVWIGPRHLNGIDASRCPSRRSITRAVPQSRHDGARPCPHSLAPRLHDAERNRLIAAVRRDGCHCSNAAFAATRNGFGSDGVGAAELPSLDVLLLRAKAMPLGGVLEDMLEAGPLLGA